LHMYRFKHVLSMMGGKQGISLQFFCYALRMITVVIETFARCQLYRLLWPWYLL